VRRNPRVDQHACVARASGEWRLALGLALAATLLALSACGSSGRGVSSAGARVPASDADTERTGSPIARVGGGCERVAAVTLRRVGRRIYRAAAHGVTVGEALARVRKSATLAAAASSSDSAATGDALRALLAGQIVRIEVIKDGKVLASAGSGTAIAPVHGSLPGTGASFALSTQAAHSYLDVTKQVTGAEVVLYQAGKRIAGTIPGPPAADLPRSGRISYAGHTYEVATLGGASYPTGRLRIALLIPRSVIRCRGAARDVALKTLGHVGERIYQEEAGSPYVRATQRHIEADPAFRRAVAARDTSAIRAAIVGFFGAHIHVVRVRVYASEPSGAQRFLYDLGGPYVLAPVHGVVRSAGRLVGRFSFAIQDDAGYMKLAHRFTGAEVLMRVGPGAEQQVMGTLRPGPAHVPDRGPVSYRGRRYEAYSFTGEAFPSGPLRISLLWPAG
jgi:hypothetical protein